MAVVDAILEPYVNAATLVEAERELDRLAARADELPVRLGDLYDDLAEHASNEDEPELAARLEKKAIAAGCGQPFVAREMLGWYLLKAGATDEGESVFRELCDERPDDTDVRLTLGHARSDAGLQAAALEAFDEALAVAKRRGFQMEIDRARIERWAEREHVGLEPDGDDLLAPPPKPLVRSHAIALAVAWFPPDQRAAALENWPDLADDFADPTRYARRLEGSLRDLARGLGQHPAIAPIDVAAFIAWADSEGYDPASGEARSVYAAELFRAGRVVPWPPSRNDGCWCGSDRKYKRCCGAT
jgi:tetratricopeptide (TPR) repeat protein